MYGAFVLWSYLAAGPRTCAWRPTPADGLGQEAVVLGGFAAAGSDTQGLTPAQPAQPAPSRVPVAHATDAADADAADAAHATDAADAAAARAGVPDTELLSPLPPAPTFAHAVAHAVAHATANATAYAHAPAPPEGSRAVRVSAGGSLVESRSFGARGGLDGRRVAGALRTDPVLQEGRCRVDSWERARRDRRGFEEDDKKTVKERFFGPDTKKVEELNKIEAEDIQSRCFSYAKEHPSSCVAMRLDSDTVRPLCARGVFVPNSQKSALPADMAEKGILEDDTPEECEDPDKHWGCRMWRDYKHDGCFGFDWGKNGSAAMKDCGVTWAQFDPTEHKPKSMVYHSPPLHVKNLHVN